MPLEYSHGITRCLQGYDKSDGYVSIDTPKKFDDYLVNSYAKDDWNDFKNNNGQTCIIYACNARDESGIVQSISNSNKGNIFVGATEYVNFYKDVGVQVFTSRDVGNGKKK